MKFAADFAEFLRDHVNLAPDLLESLEQRVNSLEEFIIERDELAALFIELIPAGSWAFRTIINPVKRNDGFDADVLFRMHEQPGWLPKHYVEELFRIFKASKRYGLRVRLHKRCIRLVWANEFHIDLVPYVERAGNHYVCYRLEPEDQGTFELANPEGFTAWMDERARATNGNFIKVVRLVKYLRDYKDTFTCVSIILTTLLGQEVDPIEAQMNPDLYKDVPTTLKTLVRKLADGLPDTMPAVLDPGGTGDNFTDRYKDKWNYENFVHMINSYADRIDAAYNENDDADKSTALWRDVFGDDFKPTKKASSSLGALVKGARHRNAATIRCEGEEFLSEKYGYQHRVNPQYKVRLDGRVTGITGAIPSSSFNQYVLANRGNRVAKGRDLRFTASTNVPPPYDVFWKVRNGGDEAASVGELRGKIERNNLGNVKVEKTLYLGNHYVECYIVKDGMLVATDRQRVTVTSGSV